MKTPVKTKVASPLCIALDTSDLDRARALVHEVGDAAGMVKVGMEFFYAHGPAGYGAIAAEGLPVFLDLKLHDIPNTVHAALSSLMRLEPAPAIVDVHATGGAAMMQAASRAVRGRCKVIAVTVLTSLSDEDLVDTGFDPARSPGELPVTLARLAQDCGLDGVVCAPVDLPAIRAASAATWHGGTASLFQTDARFESRPARVIAPFWDCHSSEIGSFRPLSRKRLAATPPFSAERLSGGDSV